VHLAAFLQTQAPTLLIDGDPNRSSTVWAKNGKLPFTVVDKEQGALEAATGNYRHVVIDTEARPGQADLETLARGCNLLVIPSGIPSTLEINALVLTIAAARELAPDKYRVLLNMVPPSDENEKEELRAILKAKNISHFPVEVPDLKAFRKAAKEGVAVNEVKDPRASRAWDAYASIGKEIIKAFAPAEKRGVHV
jgi:chromosome partitioning protein